MGSLKTRDIREVCEVRQNAGHGHGVIWVRQTSKSADMPIVGTQLHVGEVCSDPHLGLPKGKGHVRLGDKSE